MRISDLSSDVCSSDLGGEAPAARKSQRRARAARLDLSQQLRDAAPAQGAASADRPRPCVAGGDAPPGRRAAHGDTGRLRERGLPQPSPRSEEHTSELQSLMRISYAVFCLKKKNNNTEYTCMNTKQYNHNMT